MCAHVQHMCKHTNIYTHTQRHTCMHTYLYDRHMHTSPYHTHFRILCVYMHRHTNTHATVTHMHTHRHNTHVHLHITNTKQWSFFLKTPQLWRIARSFINIREFEAWPYCRMQALFFFFFFTSPHPPKFMEIQGELSLAAGPQDADHMLSMPSLPPSIYFHGGTSH